jgi:hypothetical protein
MASVLAAMLLFASMGIAPETTEQTASNPGISSSTKTLFCFQTCNYVWQRTTEAKATLHVTNNLNGDSYDCTWEGPGAPSCSGAIPACSTITSTLTAVYAPQVTTVTWHPEGAC